MKHLGDLLSGLTLPTASPEASRIECGEDLVHDMGADLPAGHLHLWGGPRGAGKTSFLLSLLYGAAARGRRVLYATYHLPASSVALRLLGMTCSLPVDRLANGDLSLEEGRRAAAARACLDRLPIFILEARGLGVRSLEDRLVRMPFRAEVLTVDYLQAIVRQGGEDVGGALRGLSSLASRLHVSVLVSLEATEGTSEAVNAIVDRAGWIAPSGTSGLRRAEVIRNRYGDRPAVPLRLDEPSGLLSRMPSGSSGSVPSGSSRSVPSGSSGSVPSGSSGSVPSGSPGPAPPGPS